MEFELGISFSPMNVVSFVENTILILKLTHTQRMTVA